RHLTVRARERISIFPTYSTMTGRCPPNTRSHRRSVRDETRVAPERWRRGRRQSRRVKRRPASEVDTAIARPYSHHRFPVPDYFWHHGSSSRREFMRMPPLAIPTILSLSHHEVHIAALERDR